MIRHLVSGSYYDADCKSVMSRCLGTPTQLGILNKKSIFVRVDEIVLSAFGQMFKLPNADWVDV